MDMYRCVSVLGILCSLSAGQVTHWGGYDTEDITLPCNPDPLPPLDERWAVWWFANNSYLGRYVPGQGFQPESDKYDVSSISGHLEVSDLVLGRDDGMYECHVLAGESDLHNYTATVNLTVGRPMTDIQVTTNGSFSSGCHQHVGLTPISCSVMSYPQANVSWELVVVDDSYCQVMTDNVTQSCWLSEDGLYNCTSSITPIRGCFGEYRCWAEHNIGQNIRNRKRQCIYSSEFEPGTVLSALYIALIAVLVFAVTVMIVVLLVGFGVFSCAACTCLAGYGCAGGIALCHHKSKQVDPEPEVTQTEVAMAAVDGGNSTDIPLYTSAPPYSQLPEKTDF